MYEMNVFRLDRLLVEIADSLSSLSAEHDFSARSRCSGASRNSTASYLHTVTSTRFTVSDPHQSPVSRPWYDNMLANRALRQTPGQRGTKYGRQMVISDHPQDVDKTHAQI